MPGLVPGIHDLLTLKEDTDGCAKDGHDDQWLRRWLRIANIFESRDAHDRRR